jgi:hypothetical protein
VGTARELMRIPNKDGCHPERSEGSRRKQILRHAQDDRFFFKVKWNESDLQETSVRPVLTDLQSQCQRQ